MPVLNPKLFQSSEPFLPNWHLVYKPWSQHRNTFFKKVEKNEKESILKLLECFSNNDVCNSVNSIPEEKKVSVEASCNEINSCYGFHQTDLPKVVSISIFCN